MFLGKLTSPFGWSSTSFLSVLARSFLQLRCRFEVVSSALISDVHGINKMTAIWKIWSLTCPFDWQSTSFLLALPRPFFLFCCKIEVVSFQHNWDWGILYLHDLITYKPLQFTSFIFLLNFFHFLFPFPPSIGSFSTSCNLQICRQHLLKH